MSIKNKVRIGLLSYILLAPFGIFLFQHMLGLAIVCLLVSFLFIVIATGDLPSKKKNRG